MEIVEIQKTIKELLSEKRYIHSVAVMNKCEELARKFNIDVETAKKVGIAHDVAKELSMEEAFKYAEKNNIELDEMEMKNDKLLHAKIGQDISIKKFNYSEQMGKAIRSHTTGLPGMDDLAKVLFIADRISDDRKFEYIEELNEILQNKGIDEAVLYVLDEKISVQMKKRKSIHTDTVITRNWLLDNM